MTSIRRVCVFCGSRPGSRAAYLDAARRMGEALAARGFGLVYGGGSVGMMGVLADAALAGGVEVTGVIPYALASRELAHQGVSELRLVESMHERKAMMSDLSDAFVALPGGLGTLEELCEVATWSQLGLHQKPVGLLDVDGYFTPFIEFLEHAVSEGFLPEHHRALIHVSPDPDALLDGLTQHTPAHRDPPAIAPAER